MPASEMDRVPASEIFWIQWGDGYDFGFKILQRFLKAGHIVKIRQYRKIHIPAKFRCAV